MDRLLGNTQLKQSLRPAFRQDRISHSYLLCGPEGSGRHTLAAVLAAAMECTAGSSRPCGVCAQCRKVNAGTHPDVITVDEPDKRFVGVDLIRRARETLAVLPNEGRRKVLVIPRAGDMNPSAQNALLKVMEEPPAYGAFLLLAQGEEQLLPTIRSRCVCLHLSPLDREEALRALEREFPLPTDRLEDAWRRAGGYLGPAKALLADPSLPPQTEEFVRVFAWQDPMGMTRLLIGLEKSKREQLLPLFSQWLELTGQALAHRSGSPAPLPQARTIAEHCRSAELLAAAGALKRAINLLSANVSPAAVCGGLQVWLEQSQTPT